jgi:predicted dehydrogenase
MKNNNKINIGIIGVGYLGNYHVQQLKGISNANVIGVYDTDNDRAKAIANQYSVNTFDSLNELFSQCDAVSIASPTSYHHNIAMEALEHGCHLFIEKPITQTVEEAQALLVKAEQIQRLIQVGHIEEFNPAYLALDKSDLNPMFIETHRLSPFNPRGTDVPVILDLMIHDIGIMLSLVKSEVKNISASGVCVVSSTVDIANARIEFQNGCVANLTASRISQKKMRKLRLFQENEYTTVDFLVGSVEKYKLEDSTIHPSKDVKIFPLEGNDKKVVTYQKPDIQKGNALRLELEHFVKSIQNMETPTVDGRSAMRALKIAIDIQHIIDGNHA